MAAGTTAVSTRVSEVRHQLAGTNERIEVRRDGKRWWYRVVVDGRDRRARWM